MKLAIHPQRQWLDHVAAAMFLYESMQRLSTANGGNDGGGNLAPNGFERLTVRASRVSLSHQEPGIAPLVLTDAAMSVTADAATGIAGFLTARRQTGEDAGGRLRVDFAGWPGSGTFLVDITADDFVTAGLVPYFDRLPDAVDGFGTVSGALSAGVDAGEITRMDLAISAVDGTIQMRVPTRRQGFVRSGWMRLTGARPILSPSVRYKSNLMMIGISHFPVICWIFTLISRLSLARLASTACRFPPPIRIGRTPPRRTSKSSF